jgi:hypothetical protein
MVVQHDVDNFRRISSQVVVICISSEVHTAIPPPYVH